MNRTKRRRYDDAGRPRPNPAPTDWTTVPTDELDAAIVAYEASLTVCRSDYAALQLHLARAERGRRDGA